MEKTFLKEDFCDLIYSVLSNYVNHSRSPSACEVATNNVCVILAHLASQLHHHDFTESFMRSYMLSLTYREYVIMEMLASMVYVTTGDVIKAISSMERSKQLSSDEFAMRNYLRYRHYRRMTEDFCKFIFETDWD